MRSGQVYPDFVLATGMVHVFPTSVEGNLFPTQHALCNAINNFLRKPPGSTSEDSAKTAPPRQSHFRMNVMLVVGVRPHLCASATEPKVINFLQQFLSLWTDGLISPFHRSPSPLHSDNRVPNFESRSNLHLLAHGQ